MITKKKGQGVFTAEMVTSYLVQAKTSLIVFVLTIDKIQQCKIVPIIMALNRF